MAVTEKDIPEVKPHKVLLKLRTDWCERLIVSSEQAQVIMNAISTAEMMDTSTHIVKSIDSDVMEMTMLSHTDYVKYKIAGLVLGDSNGS